MLSRAEIEAIAKVAHAANEAWNDYLGEDTLPFDEVRESVEDGVENAILGATARESHQNWVDFKVEEGWEYGPVKDLEAKTHPCLVPYEDLPEDQRKKDALFTAIVDALA